MSARATRLEEQEGWRNTCAAHVPARGCLQAREQYGRLLGWAVGPQASAELLLLRTGPPTGKESLKGCTVKRKKKNHLGTSTVEYLDGFPPLLPWAEALAHKGPVQHLLKSQWKDINGSWIGLYTTSIQGQSQGGLGAGHWEYFCLMVCVQGSSVKISAQIVSVTLYESVSYFEFLRRCLKSPFELHLATTVI